MKEEEHTLTKTYKKKMPVFWWTQKMSHLIFIAREFTSVAVAFFVLVLLFLIRAVGNGQEAYVAYIEMLKTPLFMFLSVFSLGGLLFHSISWFNLAPKAMVVKLGKKKVPGLFIVLANYLGWLVISIALVWFLL